MSGHENHEKQVVSSFSATKSQDPTSNEEVLKRLRKSIFLNDGLIVDRVMDELNSEDRRVLQLTNREFFHIVVGHTETWGKREIVITKVNAAEIANRMLIGNSNRIWTSARVELLNKVDFKSLQFVWEELKSLCVENIISIKNVLAAPSPDPADVREFSKSLMQDVLLHAERLTRLEVRADLLCASSLDDLKKLDTFWNQLTHLEIWFPDFRNQQNPILFDQFDFVDNNMYPSFVHGKSDLSQSYFQHLSTVQWSKLETLKMQTVEAMTLKIISGNFLKTVRTLYLNSGAEGLDVSLWSVMKDICMHNLVHLTTRITTPDAEAHVSFRSFFDKQPRLTSLDLQVRYLRVDLFEVDEQRILPYPLKHFNLEFCNVRKSKKTNSGGKSNFSFQLLTKLDQMETLTFKAFERYEGYDEAWPTVPTAEQIIQYVPSSLTALSLKLSSALRGFDHNPESEPAQILKDELERLARLKIPNLTQFNVQVLWFRRSSGILTRKYYYDDDVSVSDYDDNDGAQDEPEFVYPVYDRYRYRYRNHLADQDGLPDADADSGEIDSDGSDVSAVWMIRRW